MLILILVLTFGYAISVFVYTELTPPNVERAIRGRRLMGYSQKNTFKKLSSWEKFMLSEQKKRESLDAILVKSKSTALYIS